MIGIMTFVVIYGRVAIYANLPIAYWNP